MHSLIRQILRYIKIVLLGLATKILSPKISAQFQKQSHSRCLGWINLSLLSNLQNNKLKNIFTSLFLKKCMLMVEYLQDVGKKNERKSGPPPTDTHSSPAPLPSSHKLQVQNRHLVHACGTCQWTGLLSHPQFFQPRPSASSSFSSVSAPKSGGDAAFSWLMVTLLHTL